MPETLLEVLDPGLERGDVVLQLRKIAFDDVAPAVLVGEARLDPAQGLRDRVVLLLEPLESPIDVIEVAEHLLTQLGDLLTQLGDLLTHLRELAGNLRELGAEKFNELRV